MAYSVIFPLSKVPHSSVISPINEFFSLKRMLLKAPYFPFFSVEMGSN